MEESMIEGLVKGQEVCPGADLSGMNPKECVPETDASGGNPEGSVPETGAVSGACPQSFLEMIADTFPGKHQDIRSYSGLALAYIGDVVYDLVIRTMVVSRANRSVNDLHRITVRYVSAGAQSKIVQALMGSLTEEEQSVYRRGKNSKPHTTAKNASVADYLRATGFEAVLGYLYLKDDMERVLYLVKKGIELAGLEI